MNVKRSRTLEKEIITGIQDGPDFQLYFHLPQKMNENESIDLFPFSFRLDILFNTKRL